MLTFTQRTPSSYACSDPTTASAWLIEQGYRSEDPHSQYEYIRLRKGRSLIVVYHSGSVLLQGTDVATPRTLLESLTMQPVADDLPF